MNSLPMFFHNASLLSKRWQSLLLILPLVIAACSGPRPANPPIEFERAFLNNYIRLATNEPIWPLKTSEPLALLLQSYTSNEVVFPSNYNLRIFYQKDLVWREIIEVPVTRNQDRFVMTPQEPMSLFHIVSFQPLYPNLNRVYLMRVYVSGDMTTSEGQVVVAAFVDFYVTP